MEHVENCVCTRTVVFPNVACNLLLLLVTLLSVRKEHYFTVRIKCEVRDLFVFRPVQRT